MENTYTEMHAEMHADIIKFISETKDVHADSVNPFHKSKYASLAAHLAALKPIAAKHNLSILQFPETSREGHIGVRTHIIHKNGNSISSFVGIPAKDDMNGQQAGAVISYLRRYAIASVCGVATDDDDAETDRAARVSAPPAASQPPRSKTSSSSATGSTPTSQGSSEDPVVPFGKNKGSKLSELDDYNLGWWANTWEPKPWEKTGKVGPKDLALKAAAVKLWNERQNKSSDDTEIPDFQDEVPF